MSVREMVDMTDQQTANNVKEVVVAGLVAEGYLTRTQGDEVLGRYAVVFRGRSWFGRMFDRLRGEVPGERVQINLVRVVWGPDKEV